jgi:hypothetical protein
MICTVIASAAKQSMLQAQDGLLRRGVYYRAGRRPDPLAPGNDSVNTQEGRKQGGNK